MSKTKSLSKFIEDARKIHGGKYDYSKANYINAMAKVCIVCHEKDECGIEHGEFWQRPNGHLNGYGCPKCGRVRATRSIASSASEFIEKSRKIHSDKYDYSKVNYINVDTKVCIICPEHGEFWQVPESHLCGCGCPKCAGNVSLTTEDFIERAKKIHGNKYDYSKVNYANIETKVCIVCPTHGEFSQTPYTHLKGCGCFQCRNEKIGQSLASNSCTFIKRAKKIHGNKYIYDKVNYITAKDKVCIICPEHGEFWQVPDSHLRGRGCPKCKNVISKPEEEIVHLSSKLNPQQRNRKILDGREIDIYIPSLRLGIEYNGLRWHSEEFGKDSHYHLDKLKRCNEQGVRLIQIFEDEWINRRDICESKIKQICGLNHDLPKVFGRKCAIEEIGSKIAKEFLNANHIQGFVGSTAYLGAFLDGRLAGVMTFKREKPGFWELSRFATDINYQCVGVGGKMFRHFTRNYDFIEVKSFADRRWTTSPTDNLYTKLGFGLVGFIRPDYRYFKDGEMERHHKFGFRKQALHGKYGLPLTMTESEMTRELGYTRIWDCGLIKYVYT